MARIKKSQFKEIVKECLVEILSEGLAQVPAFNESILREDSRDSRKPERTQQRNNGSALDNISFGREKNENFDEAVDTSVNILTSDPVMKSIFSDTARTTLQEQISTDVAAGTNANPAAGGDRASLEMSHSDPMDIFSESANNWAALAFSEPTNKPK